MTHLCQHCATPFLEGSGVEGYCCAGCQQVYLLIQDEGLDDFYRWQDRAAQPLKDRALAEVDTAALRHAQLEVEQEDAEGGQAVFKVEGMSCMGCAWLIERLSKHQPGVVKTEASLSSSTLHLVWRKGAFDLASLGSELLRFGYRLDSEPRSAGQAARISPLCIRLLLTAVFTSNALLLTVYQQFVDIGQGGDTLVGLLSLVCLCFTLMLGAAPFFLSAYRAVQIRRWHSDWLAVALMVVFSVYAFRFGLSLGAFRIVARLGADLCSLARVEICLEYLPNCALLYSRQAKLMLEGITAGFILSLTLYPGAVWLAKVGVAGTKGQVVAVGLAFWLSHFFWMLVAVPGLMMMSAHLPFIRFGMHMFASFVLLYMSAKFFRSKRVERIDDVSELSSSRVLFKSALKQSLAMPMRLPAAMAILLATGVYINNPPDRSTVPLVLVGVFIGLTWWWGQFTFLAAFFAKRVSYPITIKSLNKIRPFCAALCLCLSGIVLFWDFNISFRRSS